MSKIVPSQLSWTEEGLGLGQLAARWAYSPPVWAVFGFLLGRSAVFGEVWPFGLAYAAAWRADRGYRSVLPVLGVALGLTAALGVFESLPYFLLRPMPIVFIVAITECAFAVFSLGLLRSLVERCLERQLAHGEVFVFFAALTLLLALDWSWGGFSLRLFLVA